MKLLRERGDSGLFAWELTNTDFMRYRGGAILQYNARIYGLRQKGYKIINKKPGHFVLDPDYSDVPLSERPYRMEIGSDNIARRIPI